MNSSILRDACPSSPHAHEYRIASWLETSGRSRALRDVPVRSKLLTRDAKRLPQLAPAPTPAMALTPPSREPTAKPYVPTRRRPTLGLLAAVAEQLRLSQPHIRTLSAAGFDEPMLLDELFEPLGLQRLSTLARLAESLNKDHAAPQALLRAFRLHGRNLGGLLRLVSTLTLLGFSERRRCCLLRHYEVARACAENGWQLKERAGMRWRETTLTMLELAEQHHFLHRLPEYLRGIARGVCTVADFERTLSKPARVRA